MKVPRKVVRKGRQKRAESWGGMDTHTILGDKLFLRWTTLGEGAPTAEGSKTTDGDKELSMQV